MVCFSGEKMLDENLILEEELNVLTKRIADGNLNPFDAYIGHIIKMKRKKLKLSQQQVAYLLGVTFQQLQKYEKGTNKINTEKLRALVYLLKIPSEVFSEGYRLFQTYLKNSLQTTKEKEDESDAQAKETENKPFYPNEEAFKKEINRIKEEYEKEGNIQNPLELYPIFNRLTEKDFQSFCQAEIEKIETPVSYQKQEKPLTKEEITEQMFHLYKKVYQNMESDPLRDILLNDLE